MTRTDIINRVFDIISLILIMGLYVGFTNFWVCIIVLLIRLCLLSRIAASIVLIVLSEQIFQISVLFGEGRWRFIPVAIGILLCWRELFHTIKGNGKSFVALMLIIAFLYLTYTYGPQNYNGSYKLERLLFAFFQLAALFLLTLSKKVSFTSLSQIMLLGAIMLVAACFELAYPRPSGIFDFDFIRRTVESRLYTDIPYIGYHTIGMSGLLGLAFLLVPQKLNLRSPYFWLSALMLVWMIVISQTRQTMIGILIIVVLRILLSKISLFKKFCITAACVIVSFVGINELSTHSEVLQDALDESSGIEERLNRGDNFEVSIAMIEQAPFFGTGLGGYTKSRTEIKYPHNIILELLVETGFIGLFVIVFIIVAYLVSSRAKWRYTTVSGGFFVIFIAVYATRAMISGSLAMNAVFLASFFVMISASHQNKLLLGD